jgi:hypothetical protein
VRSLNYQKKKKYSKKRKIWTKLPWEVFELIFSFFDVDNSKEFFEFSYCLSAFGIDSNLGSYGMKIARGLDVMQKHSRVRTSQYTNGEKKDDPVARILLNSPSIDIINGIFFHGITRDIFDSFFGFIFRNNLFHLDCFKKNTIDFS